MKRGFFFAAVPLFAATLAGAQEIVTVATRPGVTQSFFIEGMHGRKPEALALLYVGGGGNIRLRMEDGRVKFGERNFLPFIPWIARTETVTTFPAESQMEAVGINTPQDLVLVEQYLRSLNLER